MPIVLPELVAMKQCFIPRNKEKLETKRKTKWSNSIYKGSCCLCSEKMTCTLPLTFSFFVLIANSLGSRTISVDVQCPAQEGWHVSKLMAKNKWSAEGPEPGLCRTAFYNVKINFILERYWSRNTGKRRVTQLACIIISLFPGSDSLGIMSTTNMQ